MNLSVTEKLLDVQTGEFNSLVFKSSKWDVGLKKEVEQSESVMINKDHLYLIDDYKKSVGSIISIPVRAAISKKGKIWYMTGGNGKHFVQQPKAI